MARFVYHSKVPVYLIFLIGFAAIVTVVVLGGLVKGPHQQPVWNYVFPAVILGAGVLAVGSSRLIDLLTRRVQEVVPSGTKETDLAKGKGTLAFGPLAAKQKFGHMEWEIGPSVKRLFFYWLSTFVLLTLATISVVSPAVWSLPPGGAGYEGATTIGIIFAVIPLLIWANVVRFRICGELVTLTRPYSLFNRAISFGLSEIDQVDVTHRPRTRPPGKGLTITLRDGRRIEFCEADDVVDAVAHHLRLAIEGPHECSHPLADEAVL
jgi:hypothetical protein